MGFFEYLFYDILIIAFCVVFVVCIGLLYGSVKRLLESHIELKKRSKPYDPFDTYSNHKYELDTHIGNLVTSSIEAGMLDALLERRRGILEVIVSELFREIDGKDRKITLIARIVTDEDNGDAPNQKWPQLRGAEAVTADGRISAFKRFSVGVVGKSTTNILSQDAHRTRITTFNNSLTRGKISRPARALDIGIRLG